MFKTIILICSLNTPVQDAPRLPRSTSRPLRPTQNVTMCGLFGQGWNRADVDRAGVRKKLREDHVQAGRIERALIAEIGARFSESE